MKDNLKDKLISRLIAYAQIDTQSDESAADCPSTPGQLTLGRQLVRELQAIGLADAAMDENGYVMATLAANTEKNVPTIGFLAHLDTATDFTGAGVKPQVIASYDGEDIVLHEEQGVVLSPRDFPALLRYVGHTLITTDGTTLLGADNKAGIAEIVTAMAYLVRHPEIKHGKIRVAFTPDEEIGRGPHRFDVARFGADFAYTVDGGPLGELQYESFNAAAASIVCKGKNVHPGTAKGKMVHSAKIAMELHSQLPLLEAPEFTDGYEGFFHLISIEGGVEETRLNYLIRDFDRERFAGRKALMAAAVEQLQRKYGEERITLHVRDQYFNMREKIEPVMEIVDVAREAMRRLGIEPIVEPIRGGTDGSQLSYMGLPTPNLFTGGENFHGRYEFASVDDMARSCEVIVEIVRLFESRGGTSAAEDGEDKR